MRRETNLKKIILAAIFLAIGLTLPFFTMQIPEIGKMLCPMHIPVLLCGFTVGWPYGLIVGFVTPLLRSTLFGMPLLMPDAFCMAFELAAYGFSAGFLSKRTRKDIKSIYMVLVSAMLIGRMVWGLAATVVYTLLGAGFTWRIFLTVGFANAIPGILIQLIFIPVLVHRLYAADAVKAMYGEEKHIELKETCKKRFAPAVDAIERLLEEQKDSDAPVLIAIDGRCGSGKTTLGKYLKTIFDCNLFHMDDFFLRAEQRTPERMEEIGGNVDYERFGETVLQPIWKKQTVQYQPFSCKTFELADTYEIPYKKLNIIEGSYSMHPYFKNPYDLCIFMNISPDDQIANIIKRNGEDKLKDFKTKWIPKEEAYFKMFRIQENALEIMWKSLS